MKKIIILGSTGSIGVNTLEVISRYPDRFKVVALGCNSNFSLLAQQARKFMPEAIGINDVTKLKDLKKNLGGLKVRIYVGPEGLSDIAGHIDADIAVIAISGNASLIPLLRAIESKKRIALASKEPLVSAGRLIIKAARHNKVSLIPVDSEHSAIFQCLKGHKPRELKRIYITGTGGPLRSVKESYFDKLPRAKMLSHPKWKMGRKISVDSATLMNKGLEVIEARWLFNIPLDNISVLIHPQAVVHSLVEFIDSVILAQLAIPDMRLPIQYALNFPGRLENNGFAVDFRQLKNLSFYQPDFKKFPCLLLAYEALRRGGSYPAVLNAANEEAVKMYLDKKIKFTEIPKIVEKVLERHKVFENPELDDIICVDNWARNEASSIAHSLRKL